MLGQGTAVRETPEHQYGLLADSPCHNCFSKVGPAGLWNSLWCGTWMPSTLVSGLLCFPHSHMGGSQIPACVLLSHCRCEGDLSGGLYYNRRKSIPFPCNTYIHTHALIHTWVHENTPAFTHVYLYIHAHTCAKPLAYSNYAHVNIHAQTYMRIYAHTIAAFTRFTST